jgi:arsenate reductase
MGSTDVMQPTIYHNPRCSKSRATLELLTSRGFSPRVVAYLETPPTSAEIESLLAMLAVEPRELMRKDEDEYSALGLADPELTRKQLVAAIAAHPRLLQRPIVVAGSRAAIGRPPEAVLAILPD